MTDKPELRDAAEKARWALTAMVDLYGPDPAGMAMIALNELDTTLRVAGWQPIETAPKNGTRILATIKEGFVRVVAWGKTSHVPMYGFCLADQGPEDFDLCEPTHWMPLPEPPK